MSNKVTKSSVISSMFWKLMERFGTKGISLIVQIVLARLLLPEDFGTIAIVLVFISLASVFVDSGLSTALIQKRDADALDFSSVFYLSILIAGALYMIIYLAAPSIASFYDEPSLTRILRVLALSLFPGAFNSIQNAYVSRNMMFKKMFYSSLGAVLVSGIAGIVAAYSGAGVWALVIHNLTNAMTITIIMWFTVKWRPTQQFSFERVKILFSYSWKILASSLVDTFYLEFRTLIVGKMYTSTALGYFNRGEQIPKVLITSTDGAIQAVMLPTYSSMQDDDDQIKKVIRRSVRVSSFLIFPLMIGLAAVAEPLIEVILGEKWLPAAPFLQIFCVVFASEPINSAKRQAIRAIGRSDIVLKVNVINKTISIIILLLAIPFGIYAITASQIPSVIISTIVIGWPNKNLFNYNTREQIGDILPALSISGVMGIIVYLIGYIYLPAWQLLIVQIIAGVIIYVGLAKLFKLESYEYLKKTIREIVEKRKESKDNLDS